MEATENPSQQSANNEHPSLSHDGVKQEAKRVRGQGHHETEPVGHHGCAEHPKNPTEETANVADRDHPGVEYR